MATYLETHQKQLVSIQEVLDLGLGVMKKHFPDELTRRGESLKLELNDEGGLKRVVINHGFYKEGLCGWLGLSGPENHGQQKVIIFYKPTEGKVARERLVIIRNSALMVNI